MTVTIPAFGWDPVDGYGPLIFGPRDYRYAELRLTSLQIRRYEAAREEFRRKNSALGQPGVKPNDPEYTLRMEARRLLKANSIQEVLRAVLSPAQIQTALRLNLDYRLPRNMSQLRLSRQQLRSLSIVNRELAKEEAKLKQESVHALRSHMENRHQDEVYKLLTPDQRSRVRLLRHGSNLTPSFIIEHLRLGLRALERYKPTANQRRLATRMFQEFERRHYEAQIVRPGELLNTAGRVQAATDWMVLEIDKILIPAQRQQYRRDAFRPGGPLPPANPSRKSR